MKTLPAYARWCLALLCSLCWICASDIKRDEKVVFYPALGWQAKDGQAWEFVIQGRIFEPEQRALPVSALSRMLAVKVDSLSESEKAIFKERARHFMEDNERRKEVSIRIGERVFPAGRSGSSGQFTNLLRMERTTGQQIVDFTAVASKDDERIIQGRVMLLNETGVSIISDIDDTIKVSHVRDKPQLLANTFYRPFVAVPGMAALYQRWTKEQGAAVHYVSASPWQLYEPISEFVATNGFPAGTFHMKQFRVKDRSFLSLFDSPLEYKLGVIQPLLKQFPKRRFILVGDSGEKDPEVYGTLARRYPESIAHIYIRDVTEEPREAERYREAFKGLPEALWQIFKEPQEIK